MRAGRLVAWTRAWQAGAVPFDALVDAVQVGGPQRVAPAGGTEPAVPLGRVLIELGPVSPRLVLPVSGDPRGLPGPGPFTDAALAAGEAVVAGGVGLVPVGQLAARASGRSATAGGLSAPAGGLSARARGWSAPPGGPTWWTYDVPAGPDDPLTLAEAEHGLTDAVRETASALRDLDVARWRPELDAALAGLRMPAPASELPPGYPARAHRLLAQADRIDSILALAGRDAPGGAVGTGAAVARERLLRSVGTAVRRARMAAYNAGVAR